MIILDDHVETASKHTPIKAIEIQGFGDAWLESQSKTVEKWSYLVSQKRIRIFSWERHSSYSFLG